jgi:hypothetical protein
MLTDRCSERPILIFLSEWRLSTRHTRESDLKAILRERKLKQEISVWNNNLLLIPNQPEMRVQELMRLLTPCDIGICDLGQAQQFPWCFDHVLWKRKQNHCPFEGRVTLIQEMLLLRRKKCQTVCMLLEKHLEDLSKEKYLHQEHCHCAFNCPSFRTGSSFTRESWHF